MSAEQELQKISDAIMEARASALKLGMPLSVVQLQLKQRVVEADALIKAHFGLGDPFSTHLYAAMNATERGHLGTPLADTITNAQAAILAAINHIRREPMLGHQSRLPQKPLYVDEFTIARLNTIRHPSFDFSRLVQMCRELNVANENDAYVSVVLLIRAVIDHIPPVFGEATFVAVANKMPKSIKASFLNLQNSSRNIADSRLHQPIRKRETVPTATEVNFSPDLAVVLGELLSVVGG